MKNICGKWLFERNTKETLRTKQFGFGFFSHFALGEKYIFRIICQRKCKFAYCLVKQEIRQLVVELAPGNNFPSICNIWSRSNGQLLYTLSHGSASKFFPFSKASLTAVPFSIKSMSALLTERNRFIKWDAPVLISELKWTVGIELTPSMSWQFDQFDRLCPFYDDKPIDGHMCKQHVAYNL